ncbi:MAG: hypothetical protein AAGC74_09435 [Verrucomicrobiota bacterium]
MLTELVVLVLVIVAAFGLGWFLGQQKAADSEKMMARVNDSQAQLMNLRIERANLKEQVRKLREQGAEESHADVSRLLERKEEEWKKRFNEIRVAAEVEKVKRVEELERELRMLRLDERVKAEMEARNALNDDGVPEGVAVGLTPRARVVCGKLLEWEGLAPEDLEKAAESLEKELGARALIRVKFGNGSAAVRADELAAMEVAVSSTEDYSLLLAVGFADTGGDAELNRTLGAQRASNVAADLQKMLRNGQFVEPVYLGETERFGARAENRVVEIWELRR